MIPSALATLTAHFRAAWSKDTDKTVCEWLEQHVDLTENETDWPGPFRAATTPQIREPLECYRDRHVTSVTCVFGTQVCKTMILMLGTLWYLVHRAGNVLWVMDSVDNCRDFSRDRWQPLIDSCKSLSHLRSTYVAENATLRQKIAGSILYFVGSNSPGRLASKPCALVNMDECDKFPAATNAESDPIDNAQQRTKAKVHGKHIKASSPSTDQNLIWLEFLNGDQRYYHMPCPHCSKLITFEWGNVQWDSAAKVDGAWDLDRVRRSAVYLCPECSGTIRDADKTYMLRLGQWIPTNLPAPRGVRSYHCSSLYSIWPSCSFGNLAVAYLTAKAKNKLQSFRRNYLALPTTTIDEVIKPATIRQRQEKYSQPIPPGVLILTVGADVQDDRIEAELVGWGLGEESWSIDFAIFYGDTNQAAVWSDFDAWLQIPRALPIRRVGIDSGDTPDRVYKFVKPRQPRGIYALKGHSTRHRPIVSKPTNTNKYKVHLWMVGTDTAKDLLFSNLQLDTPGPGYCHFPHETSDGRYDDEYFAQLTGESKKPILANHRPDHVYVKLRPRQEALDCRVYAYHALYTLPRTALESAHKSRPAPDADQSPNPSKPRKKKSWIHNY